MVFSIGRKIAMIRPMLIHLSFIHNSIGSYPWPTKEVHIHGHGCITRNKVATNGI